MKRTLSMLDILIRTYPLGWRLRFHIWRACRLRMWLAYHEEVIFDCQMENQRLARKLDAAWPAEESV